MGRFKHFMSLSVLCIFLAALVSCNSDDDRDSQAVRVAGELLQRLIPDHRDAFVFEWIEADSGRDVFEIESLHQQIVIHGNNAVSMAMGLNWYLKYKAHADISLFGTQLNLPPELPPVREKIRRVSREKYRYMLNYCSFGYTMAWYDWDQWENLIDWMALNGINMPLAVTGQEAVWREVGLHLGVDDLTDFFAGPPYLPFSWMGCLDSWGGPLPQNWIDSHTELQKKILARERELGMTPVLQGFTGHIPPAFVKKYPHSNVQKIKWIEWETYILDPLDPLFKKIGALFLEEQEKLYGTDHLYAADSFIEMTPPSGETDYLRDLARAILAGMTGQDPQAVWVLQGWTFFNQKQFWTPERLETFLTAIPNEHIILLDLFCEQTEMWNQTRAFYGKPWLWCNIQTFGATVDMHGPLNRINKRLERARISTERGERIGLGFVNEGFEGNPLVYEYLTELAWHDRAVNLEKWLADYVLARYGLPDENLHKAWTCLLESVYSDWPRSGTFQSVNRFPRLNLPDGPPFDTKKTAQAWQLMIGAADKFKDTKTFAYDLVSMGIQVLADYSYRIQKDMLRAFADRNLPEFDRTSVQFLTLFDDSEQLASTHRQFLLGSWLADARRWGETAAEQDRQEWNARRILTVWGSGNNIRDYSRRNWSGMFSTFYRPRWEKFIEAMKYALITGTVFDEDKTTQTLLDWERAWTEKIEVLPVEAQGDYLEVSRSLWDKYGSQLLSQ